MGRLRARGLVLLASCLVLCGARGALEASFYGESYVELHMVEVSSELSLQLKFQTSKPQGLLFLAAGKNDYCIIEVVSGTVQVRVNWDTGAQAVLSEQRLHVDDLGWHLLELYCVKDNISLVIDKYYETTGKTVSGMQNFNFHHGIYVGGRGGLHVHYLDGNLPNFRGCMQDVVLNKREILRSLRSYPGFKKIHEVSLGCSDEFFAGEDEAVNFFSSRSYVVFPEWKVHGEGLLGFALQTGTQQALLLFQPGREGSFVALEIYEGRLQAHVGRSDNKSQLSSFSLVSDNEWHVIQLKFMGRYLHLLVDQQGVRVLLPSQSIPFVSQGPLFVGGLHDQMWGQVKRLELASVKSARGISLKGCLRGLKANSEKRALRDALVSKDISTGCKAKGINNANPSWTTATSLPPSELSYSTSVTQTIKPFLPEESSYSLVLNNLEVQEGGRALLEEKHMKVNVELNDLNINDSQILFKIEDMPTHGFLQLDVSPQQDMEKVFTILDLWQGKVWYVHDGSEDPIDYFTFLVYSSTKNEIPLYHPGSVPHVFNITVIPVNDPPHLKLPEGNLFLLFENSKKQLTPNIIQVADPDTDSLSLSFSVLGNFNSEAGYLENASDPGKIILGFTYVDLRDGHVFYVHRGHQNARIVLRASDGELVSNTAVLRVMAVPWDFEVAHRTGVAVLQGGTVLITQGNLSVEVNGEQHEMETHYVITRSPQFGQIECKGLDGEWKQVNTFSQRSIDQSRVQYHSTFKELQQENITDHFKFKVHVEGKMSKELIFPVTIKWLKFTLLKNVPLEIRNTHKQVLNAEHLQAATEGVEVAESELHFKLLAPPRRGKLLLGRKVLKRNSIFSQKYIIDSKISYEPKDSSREDSQDTFRFLILAEHIESKEYTFRINFKANKTHITLTNKKLFVKEGERKLITKSDLFTPTWGNQIFHYQVTKNPQHGRLTLMNFSESLDSLDNITAFTDQDILGGKLMYIHDDSETQWDEFFVVASAKGPGQESMAGDLDSEPLSTEIKVSISVEMKNDERPVRVVDKVFHVVRGSQRLLTLADLCYHDPDVDFDDGSLLYIRRGIPNGDLVRASHPMQKLFQFRQEDLQEGRVLFRHQGADSARFVLFVTDGIHYTPSFLEVRVSDPYVHIANNTGLLVQRGKASYLTTANLSVTTNQDVRTDLEVVFHIMVPPNHGRVLVNDSVSYSFSQHDLKQRGVMYKHDGGGNFDMFNLSVRVKDIDLEVGVSIQVSLEGHQYPAQTLHSKTFVVEEGNSVKLSLQAGNKDNLPSELVFTVRTPPMYGYLKKFTQEGNSMGRDVNLLWSFTQQDMDDGSILYVQTSPDQQQDRLFLDVTAGPHVLSKVEILFHIVPKWIPLEVQNFTVPEGGSRALLKDYLRIPSQYFETCEFVLLEPPRHGYVESSTFPRVKLMKFTKKQVEKELIYYVHDDSEELQDNFTIFANSSALGKQSAPQTIFVTVESVNDETPVITTNKVLQVWVNSVTEMTRGDLCAEDEDSSPQDLLYCVTPPSNGHLALKSLPSQSIQNFTQAQINEGQLVFVHAGSTKPFSSRDLKAVTNDESTGNRTITFTVVSSPRLGKLLRMNADKSTEDVSIFTQYLVDEGLILYQHTDHENTGWTVEDSFTFTTSSPPAVLGPEEFHITISYEMNESGWQSRLFANTGAAVKEGDKVLIDQSKLDASNLLFQLPELQRSSYEIWYQVTSLPHHGTIMIGNRNITKGKPNFSQYIINKFGILYLHDDSESLTDNFTFAVWPNQKSKSTTKPEADCLEEMFNITVIPVNDQAPELKTKGLRLEVLQGSRLVVGPEILKVEDLDSPPNEIRYTIIRNPNNGFLAMAYHLDMPVHHFTQADIDNSQVWFIQDGRPCSGMFYFSVTDGEHHPLYKLFHLDVIPISITLVNRTDLRLPQGQTTIPITNAHLSAVTNGKSSQIIYRMTWPLQHGWLLIENQEVTNFGQEDLDLGRLFYHMTNLTASEDQLQFSLFTLESNLTGQTLGIRVQPLLRVTSNLKIVNKVAHQLRRWDLNATELANLTNSDPTFEVTEPPVHGRLRRRAAHGKMEEDATLFTQKDIDQGLLVLESYANLTGTEVLNDSFTFLLRANYVQPAKGYLPFSIVPPDPLLLQSFTPDVPLLFTGDNLVTSVFIQKQPVVSSESMTQTETIGTLTQTKWQGADPWGQHHGKEPSVNEKVSPTRILWLPAATQVNPGVSTQPTDSSYPLMVIIPLTAVLLLLIVTVVAFCVWLLGRKEKAKPLLEPQLNLEPTIPRCRPERSVSIPTVTVTPVLRSPSSLPAILFRVPECEPMAYPAAEPMKTCAPWESWANLHPDMAKLCRQTNPTLKHNQYWV
ncbi:chondroitin sulfate proteoglycan 4 isoform X2 [Perognathus longimembris pacificus]|uniref:chondroitin sulfate proteoglycan 4 isoform X2 n=1 Tax=Perognathus longimembris pacificus TaxID=214514 RepID=UPI002019C91E|nr:chondroitin sulfate proteoglycan 4 isoform X2 [Perognathus longimembris pacificus]